MDAGKSKIMDSLKVQEQGANYSHFPRGERGYDSAYFTWLLSEKLVLSHTGRGDRWVWVKLPGHQRNEALDCRNYANAALRIIDPDMDAIERRLKGNTEQPKAAVKQKQARTRRSRYLDGDDW